MQLIVRQSILLLLENPWKQKKNSKGNDLNIFMISEQHDNNKMKLNEWIVQLLLELSYLDGQLLNNVNIHNMYVYSHYLRVVHHYLYKIWYRVYLLLRWLL